MGGTVNDHSHREQEIQNLDAALADHHSPEFELLLEIFDLPLAYKGILILLLEEGSWRASEEPIAYVYRETMRTVSRRDTERVVAKRDDEGRHWREKTTRRTPSTENIAWMHYRAETSEPCRVRKKNGRSVWRQGAGREQQREIGELNLVSIVPEELRKTMGSRQIPDWTKIAERAELDQWETEALGCMARGWTRYRSINTLVDATDKRALEAAWRRLERSNFAKVRRGIFCLAPSYPQLS
jgi:hypothetical protein